MVRAFNLSKIPEIYFGAGSIKILEKKIESLGNKIILVSGKSSFLKSKTGYWLIEFLTSKKITFEIIHISNEPTISDIDSVCDNFKNKNINAVISIGGGSVIDAGKAISAMHCEEGSIRDFLEGSKSGKVHSGKKIKFIAIPTTSGTGSETTKNAVISEIGKNGFKRSLRNDNFVPDIAIVDPELTLNCPPEITAPSGLDAFVQLFESYVSTNSSAFTDAIAFDGLIKILSSLEKAFINGSDIESRSNVAYASMLSGIALANAGLGTVHGFASSIGGFFDIPHGVICGTLIGEVNRMNIQKLTSIENKNPVLNKYIRLSKLINNTSNKSESYYLQFLIDYINQLVINLKIPSLSKFGISINVIDKIVNQTSNKNNPINLSKTELSEILNNRL
jgi:alcohol dehydrogenase class IV